MYCKYITNLKKKQYSFFFCIENYRLTPSGAQKRRCLDVRADGTQGGKAFLNASFVFAFSAACIILRRAISSTGGENIVGPIAGGLETV